jgi:predicted CoA-binding protein
MAKTVAVIGASSDRRKFGNKALRAYAQQGYKVFPVNPHETSIEGHPAFASVLDIPEPIDMATLYVQPDVAIRVLDQLAARKVGEVWLNPGADEPEVVARANELGIKTIQACSLMAIGGQR